MSDMTVTLNCGFCFQLIPHNLTPKPLTSDWSAMCCGCCNHQTLSNWFITETLLESVSYPRLREHMILVLNNPELGSPQIDTNQDVPDVPDGFYQAVAPDMDDWYSVEVHDHQVLEVVPISPR